MNSDEMQLSIMTLSDLDEIAANLETDFDDFWNYNILKQEILSATSKVFVAKSNNNIVGFAGVSFILDEAVLMKLCL